MGAGLTSGGCCNCVATISTTITFSNLCASAGIGVPSGVPVVIYQGGTAVFSGTTDGTSKLVFPAALPSTTYTVSSTSYPTPRWRATSFTTGSTTGGSASSQFQYGVGYDCCTGCPMIPLPLTLTLSAARFSAPITLTGASGTSVWTGGGHTFSPAGLYAYNLDGLHTVLTSASCTTPFSVSFGTGGSYGTVTE